MTLNACVVQPGKGRILSSGEKNELACTVQLKIKPVLDGNCFSWG